MTYEHACTSFSWAYVFSSLGYTAKSRIAESYGNSTVNTLRHCQTVFPGNSKGRSTPGECQQRCPRLAALSTPGITKRIGLDQEAKCCVERSQFPDTNPCFPPPPPALTSQAIPEPSSPALGARSVEKVSLSLGS